MNSTKPYVIKTEILSDVYTASGRVTIYRDTLSDGSREVTEVRFNDDGSVTSVRM